MPHLAKWEIYAKKSDFEPKIGLKKSDFEKKVLKNSTISHNILISLFEKNPSGSTVISYAAIKSASWSYYLSGNFGFVTSV